MGCGKENKIFCTECLSGVNFPTIPEEGGTFAASDYNDPAVKKAVWMLKYRKTKGLAEHLAQLMHERIFNRLDIKCPSKGWVMIPIPLSKSRLKERGYNQAEEIARRLSEKISTFVITNVITNVLTKTKETPTQVSVKDRRERLKNVIGSFSVKNSELVAGKNIILVDDVSTTGATIREAKKVLRASGAKKIIALVAARG